MENKENWLDRIQRGKGKEIARAFFLTFTTHEEITKKIYLKAYNIRKKKNKANFVMPLITQRVKEWKEYNFFDKSIPLKKKVYRNGRNHKQTFYLSLMNFEPIYKFCEDKHKIKFTKEEKNYLRELLLNENLRKNILRDYPNEDIINAVLKFYTKNCINKYFFLLNDIDKNPNKYKKEKKKVEEFNNPQTKKGKLRKKMFNKINKEISKKYSSNKNKTNITFNVIKIISMNNFSNVPSPVNFLFMNYVRSLDSQKEMLSSIDNKILKTLDILPLINN